MLLAMVVSYHTITGFPIEQQNNLTCLDMWAKFVATDEVYNHVADVNCTPRTGDYTDVVCNQ